MIIFPAIDLKGGQVVRLAEGDMARATVYADDPAAQARQFADLGARWLHVVDLDGAFAGEGRNVAAVEAIVAGFPGKVQLGGGIRSRDSIERWISLGVERVVMGTAALEDPALVRAAAAAHPGRIVVAVDAKGGMVATRGWADVSTLAVADLARQFEDAGVAALLALMEDAPLGHAGARKRSAAAAVQPAHDEVFHRLRPPLPPPPLRGVGIVRVEFSVLVGIVRVGRARLQGAAAAPAPGHRGGRGGRAGRLRPRGGPLERGRAARALPRGRRGRA